MESSFEKILNEIEAAKSRQDVMIAMDDRIEAYQAGNLTDEEDAALIEAAKAKLEA